MPKPLSKMSFSLFSHLDGIGIHLLPKHYYTPVPDYSWLRRNKHVWATRANLTGIHWKLDEQLEWLSANCRNYYHEVSGLEFYNGTTAGDVGPGFGPIESQVLHCFIRSNAPRRIVEIGSGVSTACMINASKRNEAEGKPPCEVVCIEPYPRKAFQNIEGISHLTQQCQTVSSDVFSRLRAGDLLFVDSTHSVKVGSDVIRIYLDIIPSLAPGVFIHIHDIFLPYLYPRSVLKNYFAWQETTLLLALLINNPGLCVLACLAALHYDCPNALGKLLSDYRARGGPDGLDEMDSSVEGHFPSSLWLKTQAL